MRVVFRLAGTVLLGIVCALPAGAQPLSPVDPARQPPVRDPTRPTTVGDPEPSPSRPVSTSLRQEAQPQRDPADPFVPVDELPPEEQYPAMPLLVSAYAFVLLALFAYLVSVARRLGTVQAEVERLERDLKKSGRAS